MIVCVCRRVSDRDIHRAVHEGAGSFDALQSDLGVGTACGRCLDCARDAWAEASARSAASSASSVAPARQAAQLSVW